MARYGLILKNTVFTAIVQHGASLDPPKSFGKLANEALEVYARALPNFVGDIRLPCISCLDYIEDVCENGKSKYFKKRPPFKVGCVVHVKKS